MWGEGYMMVGLHDGGGDLVCVILRRQSKKFHLRQYLRLFNSKFYLPLYPLRVFIQEFQCYRYLCFVVIKLCTGVLDQEHLMSFHR